MKRILIETTPPPEFGEMKDTPEYKNMIGTGRDLTYVPGFSDMRVARDEAIAKVHEGKLDAAEVPTLPVNLRWSRCQKKDGSPDSRKIITAGNMGYRAVTKDDVGQAWLKSLPAGAICAADGTIRQGDTQLMVATAERAGRNAFYKRVKTEQQMEGALKGFETAAAKFNKKGTDAFASVEKSAKVSGTLAPSDSKVNEKDAS